MTEENNKTFTDCEFEVRRLLLFARQQKEEIAALRRTVKNLEDALEKERHAHEALAASYTNLKTARMLQVSDEDVHNAQARIARLIREIDKCITLLNTETQHE